MWRLTAHHHHDQSWTNGAGTLSDIKLSCPGRPTLYFYTALKYYTAFIQFCTFALWHFYIATLLHLILSYHALGAPTPYSNTVLQYCTMHFCIFFFFTFAFLYFCILHFDIRLSYPGRPNPLLLHCCNPTILDSVVLYYCNFCTFCIFIPFYLFALLHYCTLYDYI